MPTRTHEFFSSSIVSEILRQLGTIAKRKGKAAEFARSVSYTGSPRLHFLADGDGDGEDNNSGNTHTQEDKAPIKYDSHEPDATFSHASAQWPGVVIEVSFSQKEKDLKNLAEDYILGSDGNIQVVIGLNIEYKNSKKASLSIWRPQYIKDEDGQEYLVSAQTVCEQLFRDELGNPTGADTSLTLHLQDFDSTAETSATLLAYPITISSSTLYSSLTCAEAEAKTVQELAGNKVPLKYGAKKRKRERTPPEELREEDERRWTEEEKRALKKVASRDRDWGAKGGEVG
jgi:hypothetical protein